MSSFLPSRCPYSIDAFKIETLIQDIQNEFDAVLDSGEFHKFKDILGEIESLLNTLSFLKICTK